MGPSVALIVICILYPASFAALVISFARLRSDMHAGFDRLDTRFDRLDTRFDRLDTRFDQLEAKVDGLNMTLARKGRPIDPAERSGADD